MASFSSVFRCAPPFASQNMHCHAVGARKNVATRRKLLAIGTFERSGFTLRGERSLGKRVVTGPISRAQKRTIVVFVVSFVRDSIIAEPILAAQLDGQSSTRHGCSSSRARFYGCMLASVVSAMAPPPVLRTQPR